jgi:hypothetical protein
VRIDMRGEAIGPVPRGDAKLDRRPPLQRERRYHGRILVGVDAHIVAGAPVDAFRDHRNAVGHAGDEADRVGVHPPQPRGAGARRLHLRLHRRAAGHPRALVLRVLQQRRVVAVKERRLAARADMHDARGDAEIGGIEQRRERHGGFSPFGRGISAAGSALARATTR